MTAGVLVLVIIAVLASQLNTEVPVQLLDVVAARVAMGFVVKVPVVQAAAEDVKVEALARVTANERVERLGKLDTFAACVKAEAAGGCAALPMK